MTPAKAPPRRTIRPNEKRTESCKTGDFTEGGCTVKILVIGSCTSKKLKCEEPAAKMYTGQQHKYLMKGLEKVREVDGKQTIDLAIISAKHGLLRNVMLLNLTIVHFQMATQKLAKGKSKSVVSAFKFINTRKS